MASNIRGPNQLDTSQLQRPQQQPSPRPGVQRPTSNFRDRRQAERQNEPSGMGSPNPASPRSRAESFGSQSYKAGANDESRLDDLMFRASSSDDGGQTWDAGKLDDDDDLLQISGNLDLPEQNESSTSIDHGSDTRSWRASQDQTGSMVGGGGNPLNPQNRAPQNGAGDPAVGDPAQLGDNFNTGLWANPPDPAEHNAIDPSLVGRVEIGVPNAGASHALRATGGAVAGAVGGSVAGVATGAAIAGMSVSSIVAGGALAAAGLVLSVGTLGIGLGVGAAVGVIAGAIYGYASASRAKADYLDTSQKGTVQRASRHAWLRTIMPKQLGRRVVRIVKPSSRSVVGRAFNLAFGRCQSGKKLPMEDRGRNARAEEAREDLRYAAASEIAYGVHGQREDYNKFALHASDLALQQRQNHSKERWAKDFLKPPEVATRDEMRAALRSVSQDQPSAKASQEERDLYSSNPQAFERQKYTKLHEKALKYKNRHDIINSAFEQKGGPRPWDYRLIGPDATPGTAQHEIFKRLPESMQRSLANGGGMFRDDDTGNIVSVMYDNANREVVMAFNGTAGNTWAQLGVGGSETERAQSRTNYSNYTGGVPPSVKQAAAIGKAVREAVATYNASSGGTPIDVVSTGHSRGGLLATVEAIKNRGTAKTFNSEGMGGAVRDYCGIYVTGRVPDDVNITNYSVRNEHISGSGVMSGIGTTVETALGWVPFTGPLTNPPVILGDRRILPQAPELQAHPSQVMHMAYLGGGGQPPPKARMRRGPSVDDPSLYRAEANDPKPQRFSVGEFYDQNFGAAAATQGRRPGPQPRIESNLVPQHGGQGQIAEEHPNARSLDEIKRDYTNRVVLAAQDEHLLQEIMGDPKMSNKGFDLNDLDRAKFRENLPKMANVFSLGVRREEDVEPQARTAIRTALAKTFQGR